MRHFASSEEITSFVEGLRIRTPSVNGVVPFLVKTVSTTFDVPTATLTSYSDEPLIQRLQVFVVWVASRWLGLDTRFVEKQFHPFPNNWLYSNLLEFETYARRFGFGLNTFDKRNICGLKHELPDIMGRLLVSCPLYESRTPAT